MTFPGRAGRSAPHAGCVQAGPKPETHPDVRLMWPRSVLQRLRTRMGVPRGLMPRATFEDTFTSAASCRRPTRGLQDPQNEYGLPPRPSPSHHAQAMPTPSLGLDGRWPGPQASAPPSSPPQAVEEGLRNAMEVWGSSVRWGSLREWNRVGPKRNRMGVPWEGSRVGKMGGGSGWGLPEAHSPGAVQANLGVQGQLHPKPCQQLD